MKDKKMPGIETVCHSEDGPGCCFTSKLFPSQKTPLSVTSQVTLAPATRGLTHRLGP